MNFAAAVPWTSASPVLGVPCDARRGDFVSHATLQAHADSLVIGAWIGYLSCQLLILTLRT